MGGHCSANCQIFVEKRGLAVLFPIMMRKGSRPKARSAVCDNDEHTISIIQSLCRYCTGTAVARILNKFTENRFEKLERLLEMHEEYARSVRAADELRHSGQMQALDRELAVDAEEQLFLDRCDAGLFTLQQVDITLVRLANMGNRQVSDEICKLLDTKGISTDEVSETILEYNTHLNESAVEEKAQLSSFLKKMLSRMPLSS